MLHVTRDEMEAPLLSSRVIHSIPVVRSLWTKGWGLYETTKGSNTFVKAGFELAERTAQPFVQKYKAVDHFASHQVDKVSTMIPSTNTLLQSAAYPVGYAYGVALGGMTVIERGIEGTRLGDVLEKVYDAADSVIDGVLPSEEEDDNREPALRRKNPIRRVGKRVSASSLRAMPRNAINFVWGTTKNATRTAVISSADYGILILWNRVDASYRNLERVAGFLSRVDFVRNLVARSIPIYFDLTDKYELTKHLRHEGAHFVQEALTSALGQLDALHSLMLGSYPHTSQIIEKISMRIFNLESMLEYARTKKRSLPFDESEEERLKKRERFNFREPGKREEKGAWHKASGRSKKHHVLRAAEWPQVSTSAAKPVAQDNPYAVLSKAPQELPSSETSAKVEHHKSGDANKDAPELKEDGEATETMESKNQSLADRARLEMEKWDQQEREALEEKQRKEREQKKAAKRAMKEHARKEAEEAKAEHERLLKKQMERREKEKHRAEREAQLAKEKNENEAFEKDLAHFQAIQAHKAAKAARDAEIHKQKKREEIERNVQRALHQRELEEQREEQKPERVAYRHAKELIAEEMKEQKEKAESEHTEEVSNPLPEAKKADKKQGAPKSSNKLTKKVLSDIREEKKEVSVIGGTKIVDKHTNWVKHSDADGPWQQVQAGHVTRMRADEVIKPSLTQEDKQSNPYSALEAALPTAAGGAGK